MIHERSQKKMRSRRSLAIVLVLLLAQALASLSAEECDPRCTTGKCDTDGKCICDVPDSSTILEGDRKFMGGEFCDKEHLMCDGSNSFWCANGATCYEIIQGENYTCSCKDGYNGSHCELTGVPCGNSFCYHQAECLQTDILCECPPEWKGSVDCSLPTPKNPINKTSTQPLTNRTSSNNGDKGYVPFSVMFGVGVVVLLVVLARKVYKKRTRQGTEFRQVQMGGFMDDDDDSFSNEPLSKGDDL